MYSSKDRFGHTRMIPSEASSLVKDSTDSFSVGSFFLFGFFLGSFGGGGGGGSFAAASFLAFILAALSFLA